MNVSEKTKTLLAGSSVIRKLFEEGREMAAVIGEENVYDFSLGNPFVSPPGMVKESILRLLDEKEPGYLHGYMKNAGYDEVRRAVAKSLNRRFDMHYQPNNIMMTVGAAGGLTCIFSSLLNPGDEVVCFAPYFGEYRSYVMNFYGNLVVVPADTRDFQPNLEALDSYINERTKVLLINNPNNPSGVIYSRESLIRLQEILEQAARRIGHTICVVSDEPYRELAYDGAEVPYMPKYIKNCIVGYSFSKSLSLPGERIGYLAISPEIESYQELEDALIVSNRALGFINAPSLFQLVVKDCLEEKVNIDIYDKNRKLLYESLTTLGFTCVKPQGAFYMLVKSPVANEQEFVDEGKKHHILMVSTSSFGCPGYVRLAYCVPYETIERSLPAFQKLAETYFGKE